MSEPGKTRLVRYDPERHGDGPWQVVGTVFESYGYEIGEYDEDVARPHEFYVEPAGAFIVAETDDGRVVGCIGITDEGDGEFRLNRLYTLPEARRVGLGTRLVQWVIDEARKRGGRKLVLFSDVAFEDAHRLYERMGFRRNRFRYAPDHWQSREWGFEMMLGEGA